MNREEVRQTRREIETDPAGYVQRYRGPRLEPPKVDLKTRRVTVRFSENDLEEVAARCKRMGIGISTFVRMAVKQFMYEVDESNPPDSAREVAVSSES